MLTSIIIVNYNTPRVLAECIDSLYKFENQNDFEVIIIDNASGDNSKEIIESICKQYNNVSAEYLNELKSFSYANNVGIKRAKGDFILIMNPDIIFTEPVLGRLTDQLQQNPDFGAVSPALVGTDGKFQRNYFQRYPTIRQFVFYYSIFAGLFNRSAKRMNKYLENQDIDISTKQIFYTEQIPCAFFLTKKSILNAINLMDEKFILFFEDVDLSHRIHKSNKLAVDTSVKVTHLGGASFKTTENWWMHGRFIKSMVYFFEKHYGGFSAFVLKALVRLNSYFILLIESIKSIFGRKDSYRVKKHGHLLKLMNEK